MIKCGQRISSSNSWGPGSRCERSGQHVLVYGGDRPITKNDVYCNVHKAGRERRIWDTNTFRPLTDEDKAILEAAQTKENEEARERARIQAAENRRVRKERREAAWAELDDPASFIVHEDSPYYSRSDKRWTYSAGRTPERGLFNSIQFDLNNEEEGFPYTLRLRSTGTMTPNEARALSDALREAAAKADALNERMHSGAITLGDETE